MINLDAKKSVARKLNIDWADISNNDLFTAEDIQQYLNDGAIEAYDYKSWDFAEHSKTATLDATSITNGYVRYPNEIAPSSIYYLSINAKEYKKRNFTSFKKKFEDDANSQEKIWAEFKRLIFFNTNVASAGQVIDIYGKKNFTQLSGDDDLLPFSPDTDVENYSGNKAIILLAYAEALSSDKMKNSAQAEIERKKAYSILDILFARQAEGRSSEQVSNRPMFEVGDMFGSGSKGSSEIGTFNTF